VTQNSSIKNFEQHKSMNFWLFQMAGWTPFFFLQIAAFGGNSLIDAYALVYAFSITALALVTSCILRVLLKKYNGTKTHTGLWLVCVFIVCLIAAIAVDLAHHSSWYLLAQYEERADVIYSAQPIGGIMFLLLPTYLVWSLFYFVITKQETLKNTIYEQQQLAFKLKEYQLNSLLKQLNPHFMFNTINNIRSLILKDPESARDMLTSFADIMRYQVNINNTSLVSVNEELEFVREYLTLCKLHIGKRLIYEECIDEHLLCQKIPRMAIQLLIENAIKHGVSQSSTPSVLSLWITDKEADVNRWEIKVRNIGQINQTNSNSGVGLANLNQRFALSHQEKAVIELKQVNDTVESIITLSKG
jgi:hypothetical protein